MIERFYDPLAGQIYLDGQLITELNIQEYRKQIALVSQEPSLYVRGDLHFFNDYFNSLLVWNYPLQHSAWCHQARRPGYSRRD